MVADGVSQKTSKSPRALRALAGRPRARLLRAISLESYPRIARTILSLLDTRGECAPSLFIGTLESVAMRRTRRGPRISDVSAVSLSNLLGAGFSLVRYTTRSVKASVLSTLKSATALASTMFVTSSLIGEASR